MSRNMLRHATLVNTIKSPLNFLLDFYNSQTCTSPTYSHRQDYLNLSSATETPNSPPNSGKPLCNTSRSNSVYQLPFTHKQTDQQKSQTKPSFKSYETGYQ